MTTLSDDSPRSYELGDVQSYPVVAADIIYEGAFVGLSSGNARPLQAGDQFVGIAEQQVDNSAGSAGDKRVRVLTEGQVEIAVAGVTGIGDVGSIVYASDDDTLTLTASTNTPVGFISRFVSSGVAVVKFSANGPLAAAPTAAETTLTNAGTASDYAIQAMTNSSPYGFVTQAEGETVVEVVLNNQARLNEVVAALQAAGLMA